MNTFRTYNTKTRQVLELEGFPFFIFFWGFILRLTTCMHQATNRKKSSTDVRHTALVKRGKLHNNNMSSHIGITRHETYRIFSNMPTYDFLSIPIASGAASV